MSMKRVKRLGLRQDVLEALGRSNILTCKDVLMRSELELMRLVGFGSRTIRELTLAASKGARPVPCTAYEIWCSRQTTPGFFRTSLPGLDEVLHGGLPTGTITEIAGPSGCGKTQFSLMLSVLATLPPEHGGLDGAVLFIDTESTFSPQRLMEIASERYPEYFGEAELSRLSASVYVSQVQTCTQLLTRLKELEKDVIRWGVKLVVVDSIASLVRKEYDNRVGTSMADRTRLLAQEATILKYLAETFCIPVLVTNQITTRFGYNDQHEAEGEVSLEGDGSYVTVALGNTWSHSVNTRLILQYHHGNHRQILVAKSPIAPFTVFTYTVQAKGIVLEEGSAGHYEGTDPGVQRIRVRSALPMGTHPT